MSFHNSALQGGGATVAKIPFPLPTPYAVGLTFSVIYSDLQVPWLFYGKNPFSSIFVIFAIVTLIGFFLFFQFYSLFFSFMSVWMLSLGLFQLQSIIRAFSFTCSVSCSFSAPVNQLVVNQIGRGLRGMARMPFEPFVQKQTIPHPWTPATFFDSDAYEKLRRRYDRYITDGMGKTQADERYKRLFRIGTIISTNHLSSNSTLSNVSDNVLSQQNPLREVQCEIGIMYDELFLSLANPSPNNEWCLKLLAIRDAMYRHWSKNPKMHTSFNTAILVVICNAMAILDIRTLATADGNKRRMASSLTHALPYEWKLVICRPKKTIHPQQAQNVYQFLLLQLSGTSGSLPDGEHIVYMAIAGDKPYIGRTAVHRVARKGLPGFGPRWRTTYAAKIYKKSDGDIAHFNSSRRMGASTSL